MVVGTVERQEDMAGAFRLLTAEPLWENVSLHRSDRAPLTFSGSAIARHCCQFYTNQLLELVLWRRRLTGFVISYPVCQQDTIIGEAVLVDNLAEATLFVEDLCAFPPMIEPMVQPSLTGLLSIHRQAHFNERFSALVGQALADWALLNYDCGPKANTRKGQK